MIYEHDKSFTPINIDSVIPTEEDKSLFKDIEDKIFDFSVKLLNTAQYIKNTRKLNLRISTIESLTAGLIMSSLVNVAFGGEFKYGGFSVYNTDAKRVFAGVNVLELYSHKCAKEMAVGLLKNSNSNFAIAVSGNAMPYPEELERLGEVFFGIAAYDKDGNIIYETIAANNCLWPGDPFTKRCFKWIDDHKPYPSRNDTSSISRIVRSITTIKALEFALDFINRHIDTIDDPFQNDYEQSDMYSNGIWNKLPRGKNKPVYPKAKYEGREKGIICLSNGEPSSNCNYSNSPEDRRLDTKELPNYDSLLSKSIASNVITKALQQNAGRKLIKKRKSKKTKKKSKKRN